MSIRMLIDARHEEETRVAIVKGSRIEEFDYEASARRQLKGNIYLARVTRVEPSLQAAFVEYGGNRHGFLAFSEIHPDYYQIPVEDREALIAEERAEADKDTTEEEGREASAEDGDDIRPAPRHSSSARRRYRIQEVIKRRQILLVQVVKEERGNKGAALTSYISLAGRYCVLMPNSTNGGGISRKIANAQDRKRLKTVMDALSVPEGMGCIIRTAGLSRTKSEIKRDFDYLARLWEGIRDTTLKSVAPCLIHEEANLIKRSIRDQYTREIDEVLVEGDKGYRTAKDFMRLLMPSHAKKVQHYKDSIPLFHRYQVEQQLESMYNPMVELKSGGYIVINPTEALVAIDVNSGRSTREHNIEETAHKTNLEAAEEVARQLRLRDMAGLVVIDFIDMDERSHDRAVERRLKEALKADRARVQVGRISSFGLMEMSRQRLRPNLLESSMEVCPHCQGSGVIRSTDSQALRILRALEEEGVRNRSALVTIATSSDVAVYLLNKKRKLLGELEARYGFQIQVLAQDNEDFGTEGFRLDRQARGTEEEAQDGELAPPSKADEVRTEDGERSEEDGAKKKRRRRRRRKKSEDAPETETLSETPDGSVSDVADNEDKPKRRRRRRKSADETAGDTVETEARVSEPTNDAVASPGTDTIGDAEPNEKPKRRRVRRRKPVDVDAETAVESKTEEEAASSPDPSSDGPAKPKRRRVRKPKADAGETPALYVDAPALETATEPAIQETVTPTLEPPATTQAPKRAPSVQAGKKDVVLAKDVAGVERTTIGTTSEEEGQLEEKKKRKGWWNKAFGG